MCSTDPRSFFRVALRDFLHVGTVFPSSRWATKTISARLPKPSRCVVEYGGGDGRVTRQLLKKLPKDGKLVSFEVNQNFVKTLKAIGDPRLDVIGGDVVTLSSRLKEICPDGIDAVVSGIPFSFLPPEDRELLVRNTYRVLRPGGKFVVYQNSPMMRKPLKKVFGRVSLRMEPRNLPPYFIMIASR